MMRWRGRTWAARARVLLVLAVAAVVLPPAPPSSALPSVRAWIGGDGEAWSVAANWSPLGIPQDGDSLVFSDGGSSQDDLPSLTVASIAFTGSHRVEGVWPTSYLQVDGDISVASGTQPEMWWLHIELPVGEHRFDADGNLALAGVLTGGGSILKTGEGNLVLNGVNTYTGVTTVEAGSLYPTTGQALGSAIAATIIGPDGRLIPSFSGESSPEPLVISGSGPDGSGALVSPFGSWFAGPITLDGDVVDIAVTYGTLRFDGPLSGAAGLRKSGAGDLALGAANSYTGGTEVTAGTLVSEHDTGLGSGATNVKSGATLLLRGDLSVANEMTLEGGGLGGALRSEQGDSLVTGAVTLSTGTAHLATAEAASLTLSGAIGGPGGVITDGNVMLVGHDLSTWAGTTRARSGELVLARNLDNAAVPGTLDIGHELGMVPAGVILSADDQIADHAPVSVGPWGTFDISGYRETIGTLTSSGDVLLGGDGLVPATLTTDDIVLSAGSVRFALSATVSDRLVVRGAVRFQGASLTLDLSGVPEPGTQLVIVDNDGADAVQGTFHNVPEGTTIDLGGVILTVTYQGGTGNDVVLVSSAAAEPPPDDPTPDDPPTADPAASGYWMIGSDGVVYGFGDAKAFGNAAVGAAHAVDLEPTPSGNGYWIVDDQGRVYAFGDAAWNGNVDGARLSKGETVTSLSATHTGNGYWVFTSKGRVLSFGDATFFGDVSAMTLNGPVLDSIPTPTGQGYYMVASDGGIFAFGDARFAGSMGGSRLNAPVQSLVPDSDRVGYWLVASDGGIFAFEAGFNGSMGSVRLNKPVTGMVRYGNAYLMVSEDGGIFNFSDKPFSGSLGATPPARPIVSVAVIER